MYIHNLAHLLSVSFSFILFKEVIIIDRDGRFLPQFKIFQRELRGTFRGKVLTELIKFTVVWVGLVCSLRRILLTSIIYCIAYETFTKLIKRKVLQ